MAKRKRASASTVSVSSPSVSDPTSSESSSIWSKSKKKRMRRMRAKQNKGTIDRVQKEMRNGSVKGSSSQIKETLTQNPESVSQVNSKREKSSALQQSFLARLSGSRFRELNEELYTTTSSSAYTRFSSHPELYVQYHQGFRRQVEQWPVNPVHVVYKWLVSKVRKQNKKFGTTTVADFGCGDAELAKKLGRFRHNGKCPFVVHSFDLVASCELVTACDMASVPIEDGSVDVGVFCLSLMGTNLSDFVREAHRVLRANGRLKIAEVRSRFATSGTDELKEFIDVLDHLGFSCVNTDKSNKMFVLLEFEKNDKVPDTKLCFTAKPCIYKRR